MFTNFTCSSYLIIWHIKIQLNHWQWHNNQWKWKWNTQSEISLCHHSTSINWDKHWFLYMCSEEMEFNKINEWSEKLSAQQNVKHWTKSRGQSSSNRCQRTGVTKTTTTKDSGLAYSSKEAAATSLQLLPNLFHFSVRRPPNAWWSQ